MRPATTWLMATLLFTGAACAHREAQTSSTHEAASTHEATPFPEDVRDFIERREGCDHFRGEEPYDEARAAFIAQELERLCRGTDAELESLKRSHANAPEVLEVLNRFDAQVE